MTIPQQSQARVLEDLPPELLRQIFELCAVDFAHGKTNLLNLSVVNKYFRNIISSQLFRHIRFYDFPASPGDEILHSIRRFTATPKLSSHARIVSLYLNRPARLETGIYPLTEPYHFLVLPEFIEALVRMPKVTELHIETGGGQGRRCLEGLQAAVHWSKADLNIRSLTVSFNATVIPDHISSERHYHIDFLQALPQLKSLCIEETQREARQLTLTTANYFHRTIASNLTQLRVYKTSLLDCRECGWDKDEILRLNLSGTTPEIEHLSILGELKDFKVSHLLERILLVRLTRLKYLDITDEQIMQDTKLPRGTSRLAHVEDWARNHPLNEDRSQLATRTFFKCPQLKRICFVRCMVGEVYLRGYHDAVADSTGYISPVVDYADLSDVPKVWCHGVPQTGLLHFPGFTPWQGLDERAEAD